jgi:hypothetical protein
MVVTNFTVIEVRKMSLNDLLENDWTEQEADFFTRGPEQVEQDWKTVRRARLSRYISGMLLTATLFGLVSCAVPSLLKKKNTDEVYFVKPALSEIVIEDEAPLDNYSTIVYYQQEKNESRNPSAVFIADTSNSGARNKVQKLAGEFAEDVSYNFSDYRVRESQRHMLLAKAYFAEQGRQLDLKKGEVLYCLQDVQGRMHYNIL